MGSIGDNLIASSILPLLARDYLVEVITQEPASAVFEHNPHIAKLVLKKPEDLPQHGGIEWQQWFTARAREVAKFVHLSHSCEVALALVQAQTAFNWPDSMRRKLCGRSYLEYVHDIAEVPYQFAPDFFPTEQERDKALATQRKLGSTEVIGWCVSGSRIDKIYPYSSMVVARLIKEIGWPVIMFGSGPRDFAISKAIMEQVEAQNGSLAGLHQAISPGTETQGWSVEPDAVHIKLADKPEPLWPIRRTLSQLRLCTLVIGPDTGPMWSVAMRGDIGKIVLLSHASEENITKHWRYTATLHADQERVPCWPCHRLHDSIETCRKAEHAEAAACIADINPEQLMETAKWFAQAAPEVPQAAE
jgi:ADP-heptose:LPS heptosyltransferase